MLPANTNPVVSENSNDLKRDHLRTARRMRNGIESSYPLGGVSAIGAIAMAYFGGTGIGGDESAGFLAFCVLGRSQA